ncbi:MAG: cyclic nucleotide-binding domain-containing protein [Alphaproteobacteria bacterium]|nr:cyclic nucleotide-binding domain-containing protein [Alphaproteobacteria bacterium]
MHRSTAPAENACRVARTPAEREAIYRHRYEVYVMEQGRRSAPGVDHARRRLAVPEDEAPGTTLYYMGDPSQVKGSLRMRTWRSGERPLPLTETYRCDLLPELDAMPGMELTALMLSKEIRGGRGFLSLVVQAASDAVREVGAAYLLADCAPNLLKLYLRLGLRPYGASPVKSYRGVLLPLVAIAGDVAHLRALRSPLLPVIEQGLASGAIADWPIDTLLARIAAAEGVETDLARVRADLDAVAGLPSERFLSRLSDATRTLLAQQCVVVSVDAGTTMLAEGIVDRDLYVLLEGVVEVRRDGRVVRTMGPGELLGEVAFLGDAGARSASVVTVDVVRTLILRYGFFQRLRKTDPDEALEVLAALGAVLAERAAT